MRRSLAVLVVAVVVLAAGSASAQWHLGLRMVGTGNYFPTVAASDEDPMPTIETGIFGYKEFLVGYGESLYGELSFAYDDLKMTEKADEDDPDAEDCESGLNWWYFGVAGFYKFMEGDGYDAAIGARYQYGSSKLSSDYADMPIDDDMTVEVKDFSYTATMSQISVPIRFNWYMADGKFAIGPEVAFKYTTGSTEYEYTLPTPPRADTKDGPEFTGMDTEFSLNLMFMF